MADSQKIKRIANLLDTVKGQCEPFLKECSEARLLAMMDPQQAIEKYISLASQTLTNTTISTTPSCRPILQKAISAVTTGSLDTSFVETLEQLRQVYLIDVLRPAVHDYLKDGKASLAQMKQLYDSALKIDSLFHVAVFLTRMSSYFGDSVPSGSL
ncbi:MAG: hypothetical protein K9W43_06965 [Candidatus Thorarchaeota archaeon]|nr:hypothetical protein [Candidatus Thorarchaeota archaeon]